MAGGERSGLIIPVVLWGSEPPVFRISELSVFQNGALIVAGSYDGHVIQWRVTEDGSSIYPDMFMLAHDAPITCIAPTTQSSLSTRYISCCQKGQLCVWDSSDGRCIETMKHPFVHRRIIPYTYQVSSSHSLTRLFCIGDYAEIVVIDAQDLNVLFTLSSRVEPDWINAISIVRTQSQHDVVIGVSISGMVKLWSLRDLNKKDAFSVIYEDESKAMSVKNVKALSCSTLNTRIMLLVSSSSWQIVDTCSLNQLIISECGIDAVDGMIIDVDKIAVGFVDSTIVLFQLPRSRLSGRQVQEKGGNYPGSGVDQPFVFALLKGFTGPATTSYLNSVCFYFDNRGTSNGQARRVAYRGDCNGRIAVWKIPTNFDSLVEQFLQHKRPTVYEPTIEHSLDTTWSSINAGSSGVFSTGEKKVSATIYISNQGKLLLGCADGRIIMMNACRALMAHLLEYRLNDVTQQRLLIGHHLAVNCFLYPFEESTRYDPSILVSGSMDFSVIVWNITTGTKIHRFCSQGGAIQRLIIPPDNCGARILHCICSIANDNSAALLSLKENKCILLASRQAFPIIEIKWRPLDDFMMIRCEDECVYVWQMETANLDRIVTGLVSEEVMEACHEQSGIMDGDDEAGANQAMQMLRALKNKNLSAVKKLASHSGRSMQMRVEGPDLLSAPLDIVQLKKCSDQTHVLLFNVEAIIMGLLALDQELSNSNASADNISEGSTKPSLSTLISKKQHQEAVGGLVKHSVVSQKWQLESNLFMDAARLLVSLIYAWNLDDGKDENAILQLRLYRPRSALHFGTISRNGIMSLCMPHVTNRNEDNLLFSYFSKYVHWNISSALTTIHLIGNIAISNAVMSMQCKVWHTSTRRNTLRRVPSAQSTDSAQESESQAIKEGWSGIATMHCVLLPDLVKPPAKLLSPNVELLARRWQDSCIDVRHASQALLNNELKRIESIGRKKLIQAWSPFLPTLLDPSLSIFGKSSTNNIPSASTVSHSNNTTVTQHDLGTQNVQQSSKPKVPPRANAVSSESALTAPLKNDVAGVTATRDCLSDHIQGGVNQVRRNQATAVVLLGVIGAQFPDDFDQGDVVRATAHSLLELLITPETPLLPPSSALRRAAIDLIGRGFTLWQPHLDISKVLLGLLDVAANGTPQKPETGSHGSILLPAVDASRTARHALSLIASVRSQALITALSMEVARYNSAAQHQTIQHSVPSPLIRCRQEVLRIIEQLTEKQYDDVAELIIPVGDILVHCLDISLLKQHTLVEAFPPIAKFYMIGYCPSSRRIALGGRNGTVVIHELKTMKSQVIQAHNNPITAVAFSQDGKFLAVYSAKDAKITFWQTQQSFLGMGQSQTRLFKSLAAPTEFAVLSPGGTYQPFRARLVWINSKSLTLMLPNGRENRFAL